MAENDARYKAMWAAMEKTLLEQGTKQAPESDTKSPGKEQTAKDAEYKAMWEQMENALRRRENTQSAREAAPPLPAMPESGAQIVMIEPEVAVNDAAVPENGMRMPMLPAMPYGSAKIRESQMEVLKSKAAASELAAQYEAAEKVYQDYINSEEYRAGQLQRLADQGNEMLKNTGVSIAPTASTGNGVNRTDVREAELRAIRDYYKNLYDAQLSKQIMVADLAELEAWSDEDRAALATYVNYRQNSVTSGGYAVPAQNAYNMLAAKYGREKVDELAYSWQRDQNARITKKLEEGAVDAVKGKFGASVVHSGATIPANLLGSVTGLYGTAIDIATKDKRYPTLDPNNAGNLPNVYSSTVRGQVAENISGDQYDANGNLISDGGVVRQGLAELYGAGMSAADNLARIFVTGRSEALSLGLAATGSFGQTVSQMSAQGANPVQAVAMGIISGGLEVLTEKVSLDNLLEQTKTGPKNLKTAVWTALKSGGVEVSEEEVNFLCSTIAEAGIMRGKSAYNRQVQQLLMEGKTYGEAVAIADKTLLQEAANTAVQSFLSGNISSGAMQGQAAYQTGRLGSDIGKIGLSEAEVGAMIDRGLAAEPKSESYRIARELQAKLEQGKTPTNYELARLTQANPKGYVQTMLDRKTKQEELDSDKEAVTVQNDTKSAGERVRITDNGTAMLASMIGVDNTREQFAEAKRLAAEYGVDIRLYTDYSMEQESYVDDGMIFLNTESKTDFESLVQGYVRAEQDDTLENQNVTENGQNVTLEGQNVTEQAPGVAEQTQQNQNMNGGNKNGTATEDAEGAGVLHGSSQRHDSAGAGEQTGSVAGSPGRTAQGKAVIDQRRATNDRRNRIGSLRLPKVSSAELGLKTGTEDKNIQLVPQKHWDKEMGQLAERIYQETGKNVSYVMGMIQIRGKSGRTVNVKGVITGDRIIVQADHLRFSMEQIADHEAYHGRVSYFGNRLNQEIRQHILEKFSAEEFRNVVTKYVEAMQGIYSAEELQSGEAFEQQMMQIQEEIFADAYAGINAFGAGADRFTSAVNEKMEQLGLGRYRSQENGVRETNGPPSDATGQKESTADYGGERYSVDKNEEDKYLKAANLSEEELQSGISVQRFIDQVSGMVNKAIRSKRKLKIGPVSKQHAQVVNSIMHKINPAFSADGYELWIDGTGATHIEDRHGENGKQDRSMASDEAKILIPWASQNASSGDFLRDNNGNVRRSVRYFNRDQSRAPEIYLEKQIDDDTICVSECVPDSENKRIWITSAYIKKGSNGQMLNMEETSPQPTPEAPFDGNATTDIVATPQQTVKEKFSVDDSDQEYMDAVERGDMKTAQRMVDEAAKQWGAFLNNDEANEVFEQSGEVRTFYHGTNTGEFTVFDKALLGNSSGDLGWFGKGFYFAFSYNEAATYGGRVINAYLKMKNPYDYSQLYKFKGSEYISDKYSRFAWLYNIVNQFPDIVSGMKIYAYPNDSEEGTAVSWKQVAGWMDRIEREVEFSVEQVETHYGDTAWELRADPKQKSYTNDDGETFTWTEYGMRRLFAEERDAKEPINQIGAYLSNVMGVETIPRRSIEKIDFSGAVQRAGYDGIIQSQSGDEAVVFESSQIKSADPVTYDDNGNVIPLSERFNAGQDDIRYSVDDDATEMERELDRLKDPAYQEELARSGGSAALARNQKRIEDLQWRIKRDPETYERRKERELQTEGAVAAKAVVPTQRKLEQERQEWLQREYDQKAKKPENRPTISKQELRSTLMDMFSIPAGSRSEMGNMIDGYADRLIKNGALTEDDRRHFFDRMYDAGVMTVPADDYFSEGRGLLTGGRVYVPESVKSDFGDDWNDIRRRAFGARIYFTSDRSAAGIDSWNHELASELPGMFDEDETDLRIILERIVDVAEEGRDEKMSLADYTAMLAERGDISEDQFLDDMERKLDEALRTFAEKAGLEVKLRNNADRRVENAKGKVNEKVAHQAYKDLQRRAKEREARKEMNRQQRERKELRELQQKTLKTLQWLNKNRNRAPEELKAAFDEVLSDIDIYALGAANEMRWNGRYNATWENLAQMYKDAKENDPNFLPSKELEMIVGRLDGTKIADMDLGALNDLYKAAVGLRTEFYNRNNVINDEMQRLFEEVYSDVKQEINAAPGKYTGKKLDKLLNLAQLTPMNVLQRMGGWDPNGTFYSMAKQLEKGERDMRAYSVKAKKMLQDFLTEHEDWVKKADGQGKDGIWYEVEIPQLLALEVGKKPVFGATVKVSMTPAQKVHMYLESKNVDNLRHMTGGRTFADKELYSEGKRQEALAQGRTIRMAPETVKAIVSDLTEEEMELARLLEQYYNSFATKEINRVSNILYGYDKAMGKNYAPIYTNRNYTKAEFGVFDQTAEGVGNLKGRQYSVNPSYNISALDAFEKHVDQTARFVGMAIPARNWTTLMNWREGNNSAADVITHKWGEEGKQYITDLITTLQAGEDIKTDPISSMTNKLQSTYITAIFGANPSIVLKQLGSIPLASAYLDAKNVPKPAQIKNIDRELISKYTQDLEWRTMGYSMPETKVLKDNPNWTQTNKFYNFTFGGGAITAMDGWAASVLWPWAENKVRTDFPELEMGTQEQIQNGESPFYKKVAELFEDALSRSQSTSDEIHQSSLRKSKNPIARAFTMFRSDSAQTYNTLRQKIGEAQFYIRTKEKEPVLKTAKQAVGAAFISLLMNALWSESINFLMALWKNKGKNYRDEEEELTFQSVAGEMVSGMLGSFAGTVTGGEEMLEIIGNLLTGEKIYDIETPGLEQLNDVKAAITTAGGSMREIIAGAVEVAVNGGDIGQYFKENGRDILGSVKDLAETVVMYVPGLAISGMPVSNIEAYLLGAVKWISPELGAAYDDLWKSVDKDDLTGLTGGALEGRLGRILRERSISQDRNTAETLAQLYEAGHKSVVPGRIPSSVTIDGESHKLDASMKNQYSTAWSKIVAGSLDELVATDDFQKADPEVQAKMVSNLYDYAGEMAKAELFEDYQPDSRAARYDDMVSAGVDSELANEVQVEMYKLDAADAENVEYWRLAVNATSNEDMQMAIMGSRMSDAETEKMTIAYSLDVSPDMFVTYYETRGKHDSDGNGSYTNTEVKAVIDAMGRGYTNEQKGVLWQMATGSTSSKNNPYSKSAGQKWLDAKTAGKQKP